MDELVAEGEPDRDLDELAALAEAHAGRAAAQRWAMWLTVVDIFDANETELLATLAPADLSAEKAMDLIRSVGPRRKDRPDFFTEVYRLLHNYLASVKTLVDHSRVLIRGYSESSPVRTDYEARATAVGDIPSVKFIQELRNMVLHAELPELISTVRWNAGDDKAHHILALDRAALLAKGGWAKQARRFIESQAPTFPIRKAIDDYRMEVLNLSGWLHAQFQTLHGAEVENYEGLLDEFLERHAYDIVCRGAPEGT